MSFILRYVNTVGKIEEHFIGVVAVNETDGNTLAQAIEYMFDKHGWKTFVAKAMMVLPT